MIGEDCSTETHENMTVFKLGLSDMAGVLSPRIDAAEKNIEE
jgi:hypothetical protein